jgi:exopolyphosphatase/guanosine-5'-triphosphate,3'-diphosphate pyrophosphatase
MPGEHVVAFIDIGTTSIRLLLVRIHPNHSFSVLKQEKEIVRLGEGKFVDQRLQPEAMQRAAHVCKKFYELAAASGAEEILTVATSATREAVNKAAFLRLIQQEAQLDVRLVSGLEEARLISMGLSSGIHLGSRQALFLDIGGGSTEVIVGDQGQHYYLDSLKLGSIRLSSLFFLPEEVGPVPDERYALIRQYVRDAIVRTVQQVRQFRVDLTIGSSGTVESLTDIAAFHFFSRAREPDDVLTFEQLEEVVGRLRALSQADRRRVPGLNPARADIIIAGAAILHTLMDELKVPEIGFSERGLQEGLLEDYLLKGGHAKQLLGMSVRERSVLSLGRSCNFEEEHARQVAKLALGLFDSTKSLGLHVFGDPVRELLEYAALLHDIGSFLSHTNHQAHTYYLIKNADLLGFDQTEIAIIAAAAFFHRKTLPRKKFPQYKTLDDQSREIVRVLAVCLQMAESLDRSRACAVRRVRLIPRDKKEVFLEIQADQDCQLEIWGVRNQRRAFKKVFGRKLTLAVDQQGEIR